MQDCGTTYDPRYREWFAGAAAGPKDVIIVIDTSGSMSIAGRIKLAKEAAGRNVGDVDAVSKHCHLAIAQYEHLSAECTFLDDHLLPTNDH